ncbi:unnamed protein product, partial [Rotaria magnacalcarata]
MELLLGKWKKIVSYTWFSTKSLRNSAQKVSYTWFRIKLSESYSSDDGALGIDAWFS